MSTADRFSGRLVAAYSVTQPATPGWAQHARHHDDAPDGTSGDRDDAPTGGGWQPPVWDTMPATAVLPGQTMTDATGSHRRTAQHTGDEGRGSGSPHAIIPSGYRITGGPAGTPPLLGAGGAANGGLRARGSAPWMSPGASRRRADGGTVTRAPGFRMGYLYIRASAEHRQGLHFNRPTLRGVRERDAMKGRDRTIRGMGPIVPTNRAPAQPFAGTTDTLGTPPAQPSVIGSEWSM